jgi:(2Fe-2S) ferredoxin/predicted O-methyltransferase YrrM
MEPFRYHVFVCTQQKPEGVPCCSAGGSAQVLEALQRELGVRGLADDVLVTTTGCMGTCEHGPVMIAYPEGAWYSGVKPEDVPEIVGSHLQNGKVATRLARTDTAAMKTEILDHREHYLAMLKAKDAAGILPDELHEIIRGFMASRAVLSGLELDIFTAVGEGGTAAQVAKKIGTDARATEMLLNALAALKLLAKSDGNFHNTPFSARFFAAGSKDNARPGLMHTVHMWNRWSTLTDAVRTGSRVLPRQDGESAETFITAMQQGSRERAPAIVRAVGVEGVRRMLDLGGGSGACSIAFARANPELRAEVLDLPDVVPITQSYVQRAGLSDRITARAGDMLTSPLGEGYDLILLSAICHMFSPDDNRALFRRAHAALAPGGRLAIQDFILEPDKTSPRFAALFALNMLVGTRAGSSYSEPEFTDWLRETGFSDIKRVRLPGPAGVMIATR